MMEKDWTGNSNSVFKMLGASNHAEVEREAKDFYATDPVAIDLLLKKVSLSHKVLEPACGNGCLSTRLLERGHEVHSYDIVDRGYGEVQNFFEMLTPPIEGDFSIVTNPPYKYATEFVRHALDIVPDGCLVAMFLKTTFAEGKRRWNEIFKFTPPLWCCNAWRECCAPRTQTSTICARTEGVPSPMRGGYGRKDIKEKQH